MTKWVHLNEGDDGIRRFFERVHSVLRPNGVFVLEPQEWETYAKAKRIDPVRNCLSFLFTTLITVIEQKLKETAKGLQLRPSDFSRILSDIGFSPPTHLGHTGKGGLYSECLRGVNFL